MKTCTICKIPKDEGAFYKRSENNTLRAECKKCQTIRSTKWQNKNPEKVKRQRKDFKEKNPLYARNQFLKWRYGLTLEDKQRLLDMQDGKCAICGSTDPQDYRNAWHVDHDHETDEVRGILCLRCNLAIGYLDDSPERAEILAAYLRGWKCGR